MAIDDLDGDERVVAQMQHDLARALGWSRPRAALLLGEVMVALRMQVGAQEARAIARCLPVPLRALFHDRPGPVGQPARVDRARLVALVEAGFAHWPLEDGAHAVATALGLLRSGATCSCWLEALDRTGPTPRELATCALARSGCAGSR